MSSEATAGQGPRFSVIMPAYNAEATIGASIESLLGQDFEDWEAIVLDDGSTDRTLEMARQAAKGDSRIRFFSQPNAGVGAARNAAASHAEGEFLGLLDSDDRYLPHYLSSQLAFIEANPGHDIYSCNGLFVFSNGLRVPVRKGRRFRRAQVIDVNEMLDVNLVFIVATIRRSAFERVGGFSDRRLVEDYELYMRILLSGGTHIYNPEVLALYGLTQGSLSTQFDLIQQAQLEILESLAEEFPDIDREAYEWAHARQMKRVEMARMERRLAGGQNDGARRTFFSAWSVHRTRARRYLGAATILVHPQLYRKVFLGSRLYASSGDKGTS